MTKVILALLLLTSLVLPVSSLELEAPEVLESGQERMPDETASFGEGLTELFHKSIRLLYPDIKEAVYTNIGVLCAAFLYSVLSLFSKRIQFVASAGCATGIAAILFRNTGNMLGYAADTVFEICEYGRLLCQVLTTAMAAQGGITTATALYTGTILFVTVINKLISKVVIPLVYIFLAMSVANGALDQEILKELTDAVKKAVQWFFKTLLIIFTTYMSVTGVVSGTTDLAALKTAKITISSLIPVVGSILSDASESVLVSIGIIKNTIGIYGMLAILAIFMGPFLKVGVQYIMLKVSSMICGVWGNKKIADLLDDFSSAMGLMLSMVSTVCIMMLICTVCFLKGIE